MRKVNNRYKRGIAMEMAIGVMLIMVALSIILVTVWELQFDHVRSDLTSFEEKIIEYQAEDLSNSDDVEIFVNGKKYILEKVDGELQKTELGDANE